MWEKTHVFLHKFSCCLMRDSQKKAAMQDEGRETHSSSSVYQERNDTVAIPPCILPVPSHPGGK